VEHADQDRRGCIACDLTAGRRPVPGGRVDQTAHWVVEHCVGPLGVGTLIVKPRRHLVHVADLSVGESAELGPLLRRTAAAVSEVDRFGAYGPALQVAMFGRGEEPPADDVRAVCGRIRDALR
jgi:ATP adenylyltransferase